MMKRRTGLLALLVVGLGVWARAAAAEDPVKVAPNVYKVILENERVRVLSVTMAPGGKTPMHTHPANIVYALNAARVKFTTPDGKSVDVDLKAGDIVWNEAQTHAGANIGTTEVRALVVEMKEPAKAPTK
jgi:beta-alanine degradation protein BauB